MNFFIVFLSILSSCHGILLDGLRPESHTSGGPVEEFPRDCQDLLWLGQRESKIYTIYPQRSGSFEVFCDQKTDGGGWVVIQRRKDGSEDFFRGWTDYKYGFGNKSDEFWLGNHRIWEIVNQGYYELRIDMEDFVDESRYATYRKFGIGDDSTSYALTVQDYVGTAGDAFGYHHGKQFYTKDRDSAYNCSNTFKGAWWYGHCHDSNLNGQYLRGTTSSYATGVVWETWHGYYYSLKSTEMKIRRM
ncbi:fibrinogen C domain-containing protein 1-like [Saccostrea cucullata]|uniref:fibrinogen C domain-containing protein 1-like n=1 Tax=Saccostrea cuccullata TaxID=36930 RepID=UPI002ED348A3